MGLFSGIKKAVSGVANSAKKVLGSGVGGAILEGAGSMMGFPGVGSAVSGMLGGSGGMGDVIGAGFSAYNNRRQTGQLYDQQLKSIQLQNKQFRENTAYANKLSQANAREMMRYQTASNAKQMAFQKSMSSTAHQREVADLRAAGLNPILSGTGGMGASTPSGGAGSGAQGSVATAPVVGEQEALSSAFEAFRTMAEAMKANTTREFIQGAQTDLTKAQETGTYAAAQEAGARTELHQANTILSRVKTDMTEHQIRNVDQELKNLQAIQGEIGSRTSLNYSQQSQVEQATRNLSETWKDLKMKGDISAGEYGRLLELGKRASDVAGLSDLIGLLKTFKGLKGKFK